MKSKIEYLLVDGYNIIHSWDHLKSIALYSLSEARAKLIEILSNYQGYKNIKVIIVFDAHKLKGNKGTVEKSSNITIVYTKESQTADTYIERFAAVNAKNYKVRVATSDNLEQIIIMGRGAHRLSARDLELEINNIKKEMNAKYIENKPVKNNSLLSNLDKDTAELLEKMRYPESW